MLQEYFEQYRKHVIGVNDHFESPYGTQQLLYADWTASGRGYALIEQRLTADIEPLLGNTHTETSATGTAMTMAYELSKKIIKQHVNAGPDDVLLFAGSGMTGAVNKFQRLLGLRIPERVMDYVKEGSLPSPESLAESGIRIQQLFGDYLELDPLLKPVIFVSQMEHHSNQTSWLETLADVEIIPNDSNGNVDLKALKDLLLHHAARKNKIAAITACSNVTGIQTPYAAVASLVHEQGGVCFVDFACSAPYVDINMHPAEEGAHLDAVYFSPHKFLGGPGSPGVLIFNRSLYHNLVPDQPGGGTVTYTNPWKYHEYISDIELREDGGTPPFLQGMRAALAVRLKEEMGVQNILAREAYLNRKLFEGMKKIAGIRLLEEGNDHRLGVFSFVAQDLHYNLFVKLLNDRFGVQARGGCVCAGTYGHSLLQVDELRSYAILDEIHKGHLFCKPGWIRVSIHPVMLDREVDFLLQAISEVAANGLEWAKDYSYDEETNEFRHVSFEDPIRNKVRNWFTASLH